MTFALPTEVLSLAAWRTPVPFFNHPDMRVDSDVTTCALASCHVNGRNVPGAGELNRRLVSDEYRGAPPQAESRILQAALFRDAYFTLQLVGLPATRVERVLPPWQRSDSNRRPPAFQAGALTRTELQCLVWSWRESNPRLSLSNMEPNYNHCVPRPVLQVGSIRSATRRP